jgi:PTH1 family peptidyl-tRNA hydrolase
MVVDHLAEGCGVQVSRTEGAALTARVHMAGCEVVLAKPQTFMNLSGVSVRRLLERYEIPTSDLTVLLDEAALPFGALRIRKRGSAGGHQGLKSIIGALGSDEFVRIRMGIQPDHPVSNLKAHVLGRFSRGQLEGVAEMVDRAAEAVEVIICEGIESAMNQFNRRPEPKME